MNFLNLNGYYIKYIKNKTNIILNSLKLNGCQNP